MLILTHFIYEYRHATRVKIPGGQVVLGGDNVSPLVEIGLTDPPKSGGAAAPPASHLVACLHLEYQIFVLIYLSAPVY